MYLLSRPRMHAAVARQCMPPAALCRAGVSHQPCRVRVPVRFSAPLRHLSVQRRSGRPLLAAVAASEAPAAPATQTAEVERVQGVRVVPTEQESKVMRVEYLIKWKDGAADTWEPARNVAEDILKDYESRWWNCARRGDLDTMKEMLEGGREVMVATCDENGRTALHFACGIGNSDAVRLLLDAGAVVDAGDTEGFTPLHIAAGYMHRGVLRMLLAAGADPELCDKRERSPLTLLYKLKEGTPATPEYIARRNALDEVARELESYLFEELEPAAVLAKRGEGADSEFLVRWADGSPDSWEAERNVSDAVVDDFEAGLEYAPAAALAGRRRGPRGTEYLVQWTDGSRPTWEVEGHVAVEMLLAFMDAEGGKKAAAKATAAGAAGGGAAAPEATTTGARKGPQRWRRTPSKKKGGSSTKGAVSAAAATH